MTTTRRKFLAGCTASAGLLGLGFFSFSRNALAQEPLPKIPDIPPEKGHSKKLYYTPKVPVGALREFDCSQGHYPGFVSTISEIDIRVAGLNLVDGCGVEEIPRIGIPPACNVEDLLIAAGKSNLHLQSPDHLGRKKLFFRKNQDQPLENIGTISFIKRIEYEYYWVFPVIFLPQKPWYKQCLKDVEAVVFGCCFPNGVGVYQNGLKIMWDKYNTLAIDAKAVLRP